MYHLAQVNIGRILAPIEDSLMEGFVSQLDAVNAIADHSSGFVWRLQTEAGDATAFRPYDDPFILINMSVWESLEALTDFVYRTDHRMVMKRRHEWFERFDGSYMALWWVPAGHIPTVEEARKRLDHLRTHGPSPDAFTFARPFPAPDGSASPQTQFVECA